MYKIHISLPISYVTDHAVNKFNGNDYYDFNKYVI